MPFKSKAQAKYMFATHPKMGKEFSSKTKSIKKLPDHVKPKLGTYNSMKRKHTSNPKGKFHAL